MKPILVVDDSAFARMMVKRCLSVSSLASRSILEAADGREALDVLRSNDVDLVVSDLNMPNLDGRAMLRRLRASPRLCLVPVIVVSSLVNDESRAELLRIGASVVLPKPLSPQAMTNACASLEIV